MQIHSGHQKDLLIHNFSRTENIICGRRCFELPNEKKWKAMAKRCWTLASSKQYQVGVAAERCRGNADILDEFSGILTPRSRTYADGIAGREGTYFLMHLMYDACRLWFGVKIEKQSMGASQTKMVCSKIVPWRLSWESRSEIAT